MSHDSWRVLASQESKLKVKLDGRNAWMSRQTPTPPPKRPKAKNKGDHNVVTLNATTVLMTLI